MWFYLADKNQQGSTPESSNWKHQTLFIMTCNWLICQVTALQMTWQFVLRQVWLLNPYQESGPVCIYSMCVWACIAVFVRTNFSFKPSLWGHLCIVRTFWQAQMCECVCQGDSWRNRHRWANSFSQSGGSYLNYGPAIYNLNLNPCDSTINLSDVVNLYVNFFF